MFSFLRIWGCPKSVSTVYSWRLGADFRQMTSHAKPKASDLDGGRTCCWRPFCSQDSPLRLVGFELCGTCLKSKQRLCNLSWPSGNHCGMHGVMMHGEIILLQLTQKQLYLCSMHHQIGLMFSWWELHFHQAWNEHRRRRSQAVTALGNFRKNQGPFGLGLA